MEKYKYIIIDDEPRLHFKLRSNIGFYVKYKCAATFYDPAEALLYLQKNEVDLIFLDVKMPIMSGFQFLEALQKNIFVVILTAYAEKYSLDAHQYIDKDLVFFSNKAQIKYYLPKIIARFEKMYKEKEVVQRVEKLSKNEIHTFPKKIKNKTILLKDIIYIEVIGHNIVLHTKNREEIVFRMALREAMGFLPVHIFKKISRSEIINLEYVTAFTKTTVNILEKHLSISKSHRKEIVHAFKAQKQQLLDN